jgi:hypothetical protein
VRSALVLAAAVLLLASCGDRQAVAVKEGVRQTGLPGMETTGGLTSGEAMAAGLAAPVAATKP